MADIVDFYRAHSAITDPKEFAYFFANIEKGQPIHYYQTLVNSVLLHHHSLSKTDRVLTDQDDLSLRYMDKILDAVLKKDNSDITQPRKTHDRFIGMCREYAIFTISIFRHLGYAARMRSGFDHWQGGKFIDHHLCEYWHPQVNEWVLVDSDLDNNSQYYGEYQSVNDIEPLKTNHHIFITGGKAWLLFRQEGYDPALFGIGEQWGCDFIKGNLIRDIANLNKVELLPWDFWGIMTKAYDTLTERERSKLDEYARFSLSNDTPSLARIQQVFLEDSDISVVDTVMNYDPVHARLFEVPLEL